MEELDALGADVPSTAGDPAPLVGIALAAYRPEVESFRAQLASIRAQTYGSWFCVLTLDSPLAPLRAAPALAEFFDDSRFEWHENGARLGFKGNFERAIAMTVARGARYVACSDQDDLWYPDKLAALVAVIAEKPPLSVVHADMDMMVGEEKHPRSVWELEKRDVDRADPTALFVRNVVTGASMLMDAELARGFPEVPEGAVYHDHWYAVLASFRGGVFPVRKRLHAYRQHANNVIGVRPYADFLAGRGLRELLAGEAEAVANFRARLGLVEAVRAAGMPLSWFQRVAFTRRLDAGVLLFALGACSLHRPSVARECFGLAVGKLLHIAGRGGPTQASAPSTPRHAE